MNSMDTLTKARLAERLAEDIGMTKHEAYVLVQAFFDEIAEALANNEPVKLSRFASFRLREKTARPGRNPRTGEPYEISPRRVVTFHQGAHLRSRIQEHAATRPAD